MALASIFAISLPVLLSIGAVAAWWSAAMPRIAIAFLGASLVFGQLIRFPLPGQGGGLLINDIAVVLILVAALFQLIRFRPKDHKIQTTNYGLLVLLIAPFLVWSAYLLIIHVPALGWNEAAIAAAYWVRLATHLLLLPALLLLFQDTKIRRFAHQTLIVSTALIVGLGFLQLLLFTNLVDLPSTYLQQIGAGWDPHSGRLVSTWLDPNFVGGFMVLVAPYLAFKRRYILLVLTSIALVLTQSRSSFLAAGSLLMFSPLLILHGIAATSQKHIRAIRVAMAITLLLAVTTIAAINLGPRFTRVFASDPTVELRVTSLQAIWQALAQKTFLIGEGYNAYQFAAAREGLITSFTTHSRAGSDMSLLTLWVTTGMLGVVLFLVPWVYGIILSWHRAWQRHDSTQFIPIIAFLALFVHALFVNSLLYGHILITLCLLFALSMSARSHETVI